MPAAAASSSASAFSTCGVDAGLRRHGVDGERRERLPDRRVGRQRAELPHDDQLVGESGADAGEVRVADPDPPVGVRAGERQPAFELDEPAHPRRRSALAVRRTPRGELALEPVFGPVEELRAEPDDQVRPCRGAAARHARVAERLLPGLARGVGLERRPDDVPERRSAP